jgi:probable DNA metabolism protein
VTPVVYDGTFDGLITAVFEVYEYKIPDAVITTVEHLNNSLFGSTHITHANPIKVARVIKKLKEKLTKGALTQIYHAHLSEITSIENNILRYIQYALNTKASIENDYTNADVLMLKQTSHKVRREKHRMEAFVRFQLTKDELYYALIQPDFNVLPLIIKHFKDRYADQRWLIYDTRRKYGLFYNLEEVTEVKMEFDVNTNDKTCLATIHDEKEELYQTLWHRYFSSVNIAARRNMKLHIKHMPKRYWKNLVEKKK